MGFGDFVGKIKNLGKKSFGEKLITNYTWFLISKESNEDILFIFKKDNILLISTNGLISRHTYQFIIDSESLIINNTISNNEILYNLKFINNDFIFLEHKPDDLLVFVNRTKYKNITKSIARSTLLHYNESKK